MIKLNGDDRIKLILEAPAKKLTEWEQGYLHCLVTEGGKEEFKQRIYDRIIVSAPEFESATILS